MAIYHLHGKFISRGAGQSAVAAAAYRHGAEMHFEREDRKVSYSSKHEAIHSEIMLPENTPQWLRDGLDGRDEHGASEFIWNAVERTHSRANAQLARELELALPIELSIEQNLELTRSFLKRFTERGEIVDFSYHNLANNPHIHAMSTIAPLTDEGFGSTKVPVLDEDGNPVRTHTKGGSRIRYQQWAGTKEDFEGWREAWALHVNEALERAGVDQRIDHRSNAERGLDLEPGIHIGHDASAMLERGIITDRAEEAADIRARNLRKIKERPERIFDALTDKQSVFSREDIARELHRHIDEPEAFSHLLARLEQSNALAPLREPTADEDGQEIDGRLFTTRDMLALETGMVNRAMRMNERGGFEVKERHVADALERYDFLSDEQQAAVRHVTGDSQISAVVGYAGAGKSTLLKAAREAWEAQGYSVYGATIAGKAAEELQQSSGIQSRTLASLEMALSHGSKEIQKGEVYVVDEAGMVGSKTLARLMNQVETAGAKIVLAGDPDQLQPIAAGAAMRAVIERTGYAEVSGIRRQKLDWQKEASLDFARGNIREGLHAYSSRGFHHEHDFKTQAVLGLAKHIASDIEDGRNVLALAHTNKDVQKINEAARAQLKTRGLLANEAPFPASKGERNFASGDRMVFLQNDRELGVKNGMLGRISGYEDGRLSVVTDCGRQVAFSSKRYDSVDHGYAVTVHKSQGASVDNVHVLATRSMTQNLAYVAMTRHKERLDVHYSRKSFEPFDGGMAEALSKPEVKAVSVDYETTVDFGDHRGHDTAKAIYEAGKRLVKSAIGTARGAYDWLTRKTADTDGENVATSKDQHAQRVQDRRAADESAAAEKRDLHQKAAAKPKSPSQVMAERRQRRTVHKRSQTPQEARMSDQQQQPQEQAPEPPQAQPEPQRGQVEEAHAIRQEVEQQTPAPDVQNWERKLEADAAAFKEDPAAVKPRANPVNYVENMPVHEPKPGPEQSQEGQQQPSSDLGTLLDLGGVTKDMIEMAKDSEDKYKIEWREEPTEQIRGPNESDVEKYRNQSQSRGDKGLDRD